jgi:UDP-2,4-diacetamido-2,4,6-trideoxy-beta-L-altropyranose hydrolase
MNVVIRADASSWIGSGHVVRCITLASVLRKAGAKVFFLFRRMPGDLHDELLNSGFTLHQLKKSEGLGDTEQDQPLHFPWLGASLALELDEVSTVLKGIGKVDWLIVDHYALDQQWESRLRSWVDRIMVIDDIADRSHDCDLLLDQNLFFDAESRYDGLVPDSCMRLLGPDYAMLQSDYAGLRDQARVRSGKIGRVLIYFGGFKEEGLTLLSTLNLLEAGGPDLQVDVVVSKSHPDYMNLQELAAASGRCSIHSQLPSLAPLMLKADLAIGAGGSTSWERCCLGVPALVVPLSENQRLISQGLQAGGYVQVIGDVEDNDHSTLIERLESVLSSSIDPAWSEHCLSLVDGLGAYRVANSLGLNIEH